MVGSNKGKVSFSVLSVVILWISFCSILSHAQGVKLSASKSTENFEKNFQDYVVTHFGLEDGLPQSSINDIIQTRDGYIWFATFGGLVRFDGHSFTTFNRSNTPGLESERLLKIFGDREGGIWLVPEDTQTSIMHFKNGVCTKYNFGNEITVNFGIYEDDRGNIWITALESVFRFTGNGFEKAEISQDPDLVEKALQDSKGVWIGDENYILKTTGQKVVEVYDSIPGNQSRIVQVIEHPLKPDKLLVGTSQNGIFELSKEKNKVSPVKYSLPYDYFLSFRTDQKHNIYVMTAEGVIYWDEEKFKIFDPIAPQKDVKRKIVYQDNEGNYWLGTEGDGLYKFKKSIISMIDEKDGLDNGKMLSFTKLSDGTILFSTNCGGIFEWKNGRASKSTLHSYYESACNWSVFQDSDDRIWVGGAVPFVTEALDKPGKELGAEQGYNGFGVFAITEDSEGNRWVASSNGLYVFNNEDVVTEVYTVSDGLYYDHASSLYEDKDGVMWVGTKGGLNTIKNGKVTKIRLLKYGEQDVSEPWVRAIHRDKDERGGMWFGTYGNGLFYWKDGALTNITTREGLFDDIVSHIVEDENGYFWMGSNRGISRVHKSELLDFIEGKIEEVHAYSYGKLDGMNSAETNGGFQPSTVMDSLGNIYFPTVDGVAVVSTTEVTKNEIPPPVYIEQLRTSEGIRPFSPSITLPYDNAFLEINYTAISFRRPGEVQFKYRLKGLGDSWIDVKNQRVALYSNIPPGEYTFQVIASNHDGVWNYEGASLSVTVIPPFWQTWWFYIIFGALFISMGSGIYYYKVNQLRKENERKKRFSEQLIESQETERRRIAKELHDGLGQQILVIKNRAELAQNHIHKPEEVANQLKEIMLSAMSSIGDVRNISHGLLPVHLEKFGLKEAIMNLCDQLQRTSAIEWSYHVDEIDGLIPKDKEINFYRIIQEAVNNILKHANATEASVLIKRTSTGVNALILDDGKGFKSKQKNSLKGLGLLGMEERMESLAGKLEIESEPGNGTVIRIFIPSEQYEKTV